MAALGNIIKMMAFLTETLGGKGEEKKKTEKCGP